MILSDPIVSQQGDGNSCAIGDIDRATPSVVLEGDATMERTCSMHVDNGGVTLFNDRRTTTHKSPIKREKVLKRLRGFVERFEGDDVIVSLVEDGGQYRYSFPKILFVENDVSMGGQPFELDLVECRAPAYYQFHIVRPMARVEDAYNESVKLKPETRHKLDMLLSIPPTC